MYEPTNTDMALFLLASGGYATVISIILATAIAIIAFTKGSRAIGFIFTGFMTVMASIVILHNTDSLRGNQTLFAITQHCGQLLRLIPLVVIAWIVLKEKKNSG